MEDSAVFLFGDEEQHGLVTTMDEHDEEHPIKDFPDRPHLRVLNDLGTESQQLVIGKSRQMLVSWWCLARILWEVLHPGRRWAVMCKKFEPADGLLERMWGIYLRLPPMKPKATRKQGVITIFHPNGANSQVLAFAEDSDAARSQTFSGILVDEAAFTRNLSAAYVGAKPTTMAGGKLWLVSSPNGRGLFVDLLTDSGRIEV